MKYPRGENDMTSDRTIPKRSSVTRQQAAQIIAHFGAAHVEEHGAYELAPMDTLRRRLSWYIDGDIRPADLSEVLEALEDIDALDRGVHPALERNRARTVDNGPELADALEDQLNTALNLLLDGAGCRGAWVRPDGTAITLPTYAKAA
jgi:hypothetical protein